MADLTVKQKQIFDNYKKTHPKMSDADILSALVNLGQIQLSEEQKLSLFNNSTNNDSGMGLKLEHSANPTNTTNQPQETIFLQSGRKIVITKTQDGKDLYKYYAADGTQLKPDYFKKQEGVVRVSVNRKTYTVTKNGNTTVKKAKNPLMAQIDQQQAELNKTKKQQGFLGKSWDWFKNTTGIGDGSDKAQKQLDAERKLVQQIQKGKISKKDFKEVTGQDYTKENLAKFQKGELSQVETKINGYKEGQDMATDMVGDMVSGIGAVGIYTAAVAAAPFTGGASIAVGIAAATASGALIKAGVKALDTVGTDRKYTLKDFGHDSLTGGFSGLLAPITGGMGGAVGKTVATKLGIQAVKQVGKEVAEEVVEQGVKQGVKQGIKTALTNPTGYEYVGGTLVKRGTAMAAEMATDGALGGAIDGGFRAGLDNDWDADAILSGTIEGGIGGAIMAPIIGGGMKVAGKGAQKIFGKNNVDIDANGNRVRVNDDGTVVRIDENGNKIGDAITRNVDSEQLSITDRLATASSREEFVAIRDEIKAMPAGAEKTALQQEYLRKYNEFSRKYNEEFDIRMEYKPKNQTSVKLELKENKPVSIEKAKSMLFELGFPKDEIDALDFDNNSLINIIYIHFVLKEKLFPDFKDIDFSSSQSAEIRRDIYNFLKEEPYSIAKYMSTDNIEELKKYIQFDIVKDFDNIADVLENDLFKEHYDDFMRIVPILTKNGTVKMTPEQFKELRWINESCLPLITPERVAFVDKVNSKVPDEYKLKINNFEYLGDTETLTDNLVSEYVNEVNRFLNHNINDEIPLWGSNLKNKIAQMKGISDFLDKYPVELGRNEKGLISSHEIESIMQRPDIKKIQKLLSEMTPEARKRVGLYLPEPNSDIPFDKWRDFYNFISEGTFVEGSGIPTYQFIDYVKSHNIKDLDSFAKYMHELKNTYAFAYDFYLDRFFNVLNEDYKGASALLKEIRSLTEDNKIFDDFITYAWEYIINDKNIDFKKALDSITTLKKQGVEVLPRPDVWYIIKSKDPKNIIEKFRIMKQSGFEMEYCAAEDVFDNPEISPKQLQDIIDNFEERLSMKYGNTIDIDIVRHAALMSGSGSTIIGLTSKSGLDDYQWGRILNNCCCAIKDDNKIFYDEFWNNPKAIFNKRSLVYLAQYVNKENSDLAIKICSNKDVLKDFSSWGVCRLLQKINKDNKTLVDKLIFDKEVNFSKWKLTQILENENKYALELLDLVCFNKELDFPKNKIDFIVDCNISSEISPLVLAEKTKKFFDLGFDDDFIKDILENSESLTFYSDEVLKILKQRSIDDPKTPLKDVLKALVGNTPNKLQDRIDTLILLAKFTDEEVAVFKKYGVDVDYRIEELENLINAKHHLISTTQSDINTFLKSIANTQAADDVIRNADFEQFGKKGIQLQYSREEFIKRMNELSGGDFSRAIQRAEDVEIPTLKMSQDDIVKSKEALEKYKNQYMNNTKEYNVVIDGKETKVTRFCGSQTGGSNEGDFAQIGDKLYYIKFPDETKLEQSVQEVMASELYRAAGIDAPNMKVMFDQNGKILGMASEYIPNIESEAHGNTLFDSFIADAWLADWDAPKHGNSVMRNGSCLKMDVGGSMEYRARGTKKDDFGNIVNELTSLIEQNGDYYSMTKGDVISSLKHVTNVSDEQVWKIVENLPAEYRNYTLGQKMLTRRDFIKKFETIFEQMDETKYNNILDMINDAKLQTIREFDVGTNVASLLGYEQTALGFEGLLNTRDLSGLKLKPQELATAQKMIHEIENFTKLNRVADDIPISSETKNFLNSILKGIPEFAAYFSKPQHNGTKYSLDVHILKVLQDSLKDPDYAKLNDQDKFVLKFSTLLHDIGKRYLGSNSDTGHASLSAEYVYSILDRFKLSDDMKDRIISIVENHHWFKDFNNGVMDERTIATLARRPQDWLIYKIMAKADLVNVSEDFAIKHVKGATTIDDLSQAFDKQVATIEEQIKKLREKQVVVTSTQWVDVPERVKSNGYILEARTFGRKTAEIDGVETEFKVLNLKEIADDEDMFKYGFNHLKRKDLRFIIHMPGDGSTKWFNVFKTLAQNPLNNSAQSLSMISVDDTSTYCGRMFGFILDVNNANISHAYYSNTGSGTGKGLQNFVHELFEDGHHRSYVKDQFIDFLKTERGIEIDDNSYAKITEYIMSKKFPETQLKGNFTIDGKIYKADDILDAFTFSRDQLIKETKEKTHGSHNEMVGLNAKVKGLIAKVNTFEELPEYFLRFAKENNLPIVLIGNR